MNEFELVSESEHRARVLGEVDTERTRQEMKWGQQDHPFANRRESYSVPHLYNHRSLSSLARDRCDQRFKEGSGTYADILLEEVYEAIDALDDHEARKELVQVAAVAVAAIQAIDRRQGAK
jgi:hypothetical protein